jgi:outer membrane protein OmpA-like peptidoglycan-associated protein
MSKQYVILGSFEGLFYTNQNNVLSVSDKISSETNHHLNVYEGEVKNTEFLDVFSPEDYKSYDSILLTNASNIEVNSGKGAHFSGKQKFDFNQVLLIDPEVLNSWELNGKTYGSIKSKFLGITHQISDTPYTGPDKKNNSTISPFQQTTYNPFIKARGCLSFLWRILGWLLLLLLLFWLFKMCSAPKNHTQVCDLIPKLESDISKNRKQNDSLRKIYFKNMFYEFKNLSKIYFYNNSTKELDMSRHSKIKMNDFLDKYKHLKIDIKGYKNSKNESKGIDFKRALKLKKYFISNGISSERLFIKGCGSSKSISDPKKYQKDITGNTFNRNMRVEIIIQRGAGGK